IGRRIENNDVRARGRKLLGEQQAERLLDDVRIGFVSKAKNTDSVFTGAMALDRLCQQLDLRAIEDVGSLGKARGSADARGKSGKSWIVPGEARAAVTDGTLEILRPDPGIQAEGIGDDVDVGFGKLFAEPGEHVGVADFGGDVGVDSELGN